MVIEKIAKEHSIPMKKPFFRKYLMGKGRTENVEFVLVKPLTYMNSSGIIFPELFRRYSGSGDTVVVIVDNLDLPEGTCRIKKEGSPGTHNGLRSISAHLGHNRFLRLFVGIGRPEKKQDIISYVLSGPDIHHYPIFMRGIERASEAALKLVFRPLDEVMNEYNRRTPA